MDLSLVEKNIGYTFRDKNLLRRALTLASADPDFNNQTLEFFGDAILEFIASERLYKHFRGEGEGALTERRKSIVSDAALTPVSKSLGLDGLLTRGAGDVNNKKAVPSAYEALVAAIYLDGGMRSAKNFVFSTLDFSGGSQTAKNYKGELQEELQSRRRPLPVYEIQTVGTQREPKFRVTLKLFGKNFDAEAENIKTAEQSVAKSALDYMREIKW